MPWFKVDDNLSFHHKVVAAGNAAMGLWVRAGSMCAQQLTDGFVPDHMVAALGGKALARRLVDSGLWDNADGGYTFHQWDERQPSRDQVEAERAAARERMANRRKNKGKRSANVQANTGRSSEPVREPRPDPTRPVVPTELPEVADKPPTSRKRPAKPLPDDWCPTDDHVTRCREQGIDITLAMAKFRAHAEANDRRQANWNAAFTQWLLNEKPGPAAASGPRSLPNARDIVDAPDGMSDEESWEWMMAQRKRGGA